MDPWSSNENEWVDPTPPAKLPFDLDLQPTNQQPTWPVPDFSLPSWDTPSSPKSNTGTPHLDTTTDSKSKKITPAIETLNIHTHPNSPTNSFRTAGSVNSDQWAESNQSPPNEPVVVSHQSSQELATTTSPTPTPDDLSHPTATSDPDDVRWGSFTQTDILPIASTLPFQPDSNTTTFSSDSPTQSAWNGETNLGGWDNGVAAMDLPSLGTSLPIASLHEENIDPNQVERGWSPPHFSDNGENTSESAWDNSESHNDQHGQLADQQEAQNASHETNNSALDSGVEAAATPTDPSQPPLPDTLTSQTPRPAQNSSPTDTFQSAISKTAQAAANVLKPRRFFANVGTNSSASQPSTSDSRSPENPTDQSEKIAWGDFSALEGPNSNSAAPVQQQSEQKPRAGFFRLWSSRTASAPKTSESETQGGSSVLSPGKAGAGPLPSQTHQSRDSVSSASTSSTVWPAPSPVSPEPLESSTTSTMSRLFGRFGSRSNTTSINTTNPDDDQSAVTSPSTELDANEAKILDFFKTVPIEPQPLHDDDLPLGRNLTQSKLNKKDLNMKDVFEFLSENQGTSSRQPPSSKISSTPNVADPFDFINTSHSSMQSPSESVSSSGFQPFLSQSESRARSSSHTNAQLKGSGIGVPGQIPSGDDMDDIFSAFQGPSTLTRAQSTQRSSTALFNESNRTSNRLSSQSPLSTKSIPKPLMNHSLSTQGTAQVRMTSSNPRPILRQDSGRSDTTLTKIPILPPPPSSSSRGIATTNPTSSLVSPALNKVPILSPPALSSSSTGKTSTPIPLIPPPTINTSPLNSTSIHFNSFNQSHIPPPILPDHHSLSHTPNSLKSPVQPSRQGLSKEDLSFFDSLI